jgi:hypothetical protein
MRFLTLLDLSRQPRSFQPRSHWPDGGAPRRRMVGVWLGNESGGEFANLKVSPGAVVCAVARRAAR